MEIKLKYGIDNLLFGMKEQDVIKILGKPDSSYKDEDENVVYMYHTRKLRLTFYKDEDFKSIFLRDKIKKIVSSVYTDELYTSEYFTLSKTKTQKV